jgi:hypothetical protein
MTMRPAAIAQVEVLDGYRLRLTFDDGVVGEVDLRARIVGRGGVFQALEDPTFFRRVTVHAELRTVVWPNDVDFCPDVLRHWATGEPLPEESPIGGAEACSPHDHPQPS